MADDTPLNLSDLAEACREAGYVVTEIDRGLEVSGSEDGGAFYLFPEGDWLQVRCQVFDNDPFADLGRVFFSSPVKRGRWLGAKRRDGGGVVRRLDAPSVTMRIRIAPPPPLCG
jgi:hypothetical protein